MSDADFSPFPPPGRPLWFTWRFAVAVRARPNYGPHPLTELRHLTIRRGWWPFLSWNFAGFHGYIGWKPITLHDPAYYWRVLAGVEEYRKRDCLFVQLSARLGLGEVS